MYTALPSKLDRASILFSLAKPSAIAMASATGVSDNSVPSLHYNPPLAEAYKPLLPSPAPFIFEEWTTWIYIPIYPPLENPATVSVSGLVFKPFKILIVY